MMVYIEVDKIGARCHIAQIIGGYQFFWEGSVDNIHLIFLHVV